MSNSTINECIINGVQYRCRTCFDPGREVCSLADKCTNTITWRHLLDAVDQLKTNNEELLPKTICCKCVDKLSSYYNFQLQIRNVDEKYSQLLTNFNNSVHENVSPPDDNFTEFLGESASVLPLEQYVTEIKLEDECVVPYDIAMDSSSLTHDKNNYFQNEDADDPFNETYRDPISLEDQPRSLNEEIKDAFKNDFNENSSSEESECLTEKLRGKGESDQNKRSLQGKIRVKRKFECNICRSLHSSLSLLRLHVRNVHSSFTSTSEDEEDLLPISKSFEKKIVNKYPDWFKIEQLGKRFICPLCKKSFSMNKNCRRHVITVHCRKKNLFPCGLCDYYGSCKEYLYAHIKRMHPGETYCSNTKRIVFRFGERIYSKPAPWRLVECKLCNTTFATTKELRQHLPSHCDIGTLENLQSSSSIIERWFSKMDLASVKDMISKDMRAKDWFKYYTVLNEFSFELSISDTEVEDLEDKFPTRLKKYSCELCGNEFSFKYQLFSHLKEEHFRSENLLKCSRCKLEFLSLNMYEQHRQIHCRNELKLFHCSYCPGKFVYENYLKEHHCVTQIPNYGSDIEIAGQSDNQEDMDDCLDTPINREIIIEPAETLDSRDQLKTLSCTSVSSKIKIPLEFQNQNQLIEEETTVKKLSFTQIGKEHIELDVETKNQERLLFLRDDNSKSSNSIQPLLDNLIRCGFCVLFFKNLRELRQHMPLHADGKTSIDFTGCLYVKQFEDSKSIDYEELQQQIRNAYINRQISRFYQAIDKYGNELDISDSDSNEEDADKKAMIKNYMCELCKATFTRRKRLLAHQRQRHNEDSMPFTCQDCKSQYISIHLLQQHLKKDCWNEYRRIAEQCSYCKARFIWPQNMLKHKEIQHCVIPELSNSAHVPLNSTESGPFNTAHIGYCYICPKTFSNINERNVHLNQHGLKLSTITAMKSIAHSTLWPNGKKIIFCKICDLQFTRMSKLKEHLSPNNRASKCAGPHSLASYSITNQKGFELHLELDSETESEYDAESKSRDENITIFLPYKCQVCSKFFKRKHQIAQHQRSTHNYSAMAIQCERCIFRTISQKVLDYHKATQCFNVEKKHYCRQCNFCFMWKENLENHISIFHIPKSSTNYNEETETDSLESAEKKLLNSKKVTCLICGVSVNSTSLKCHVMRHNGEKPFKCEFCEMAFTRKPDLVEHTRKHTNERPFKCTMCDKSFNYQKHFRNHMRLHNNDRPYKCNLCSVSFIKSDQLKLHLQNHTGVKPHKCDICGKSYTTNSDLVKHHNMKGHNELFWIPEVNASTCNSNLPPITPPPTADKPKHLCTVCGKYISGTSSFNIHIRNHTGEKRYQCDICGKKYLLKFHMALHRRTHFADRPYKCKQCSKSFVTQYRLKCHIRQHTGERPFECNICKKKFNRSGYLKLHMLNHTGEKPFRCGVCHHAFKCQAYLKKHIIKSGHHNEDL